MEVSQEFRGWLFSASSGGLLSFSRYYLSCRRLAQKLSASNWIVQTKKTLLKAIITEYCNVSSKLNTSDVSSKGESKYLQRHLEIFFFFSILFAEISVSGSENQFLGLKAQVLTQFPDYGHIKIFLLLIQWIFFPFSYLKFVLLEVQSFESSQFEYTASYA